MVEKGGSVAVQTGRVLIVEAKRGLSAQMQGTLRYVGYTPVATVSVARALQLLSQQDVDLVIVAGSGAARAAGPKDPRRTTLSGASGAETGPAEADGHNPYELCRKLKSDPAGQALPLLLAVPAWDKSAMLRGLEAGADYLLLAPYQSQNLLGVVRTALLNWVTAEPAEPGVEMIYEDRTYTLPGERGRLGRALLSVYEDLRSTKSLLSWQQAEVLDLRNQLRRERHETEREVLLNEMVQGIAHDFANLMETVGTAAAVVTSSSPKLSRYRTAIESALAQAESLISILQNCALFGDEHLPLTAVDAEEVVKEVLQAAVLELRAPLVRVQTRVESLPALWTNATILARCLSNLIWNAVQAMPSGGVLEITGLAEGGRVILTVSDTGSGISKEMQGKIFETQLSTKRGHRGMGLTLVRSLVQRSGGEIALIDRPGCGATFALSFRVADRESVSPQAAEYGKRAIEVG